MKTNNKNSAKVIHTLKWTPYHNPYKLGRGHEADVRVTNDISVSRLHMQISYKNGDFIITDLKSKFGTLVLIKDEIKVHPNEHKAIQVGRTVLSFGLRDANMYHKHFFSTYKDQGKFLTRFSINSDINNHFYILERNAEEFFERDFQVPYFGMPDASEDADIPPQEHIEHLVPRFRTHDNHPVMKGTALPREEYEIDFSMIVNNQLDMERYERGRR